MLFDLCTWGNELQLHHPASKYQDKFEIEHHIKDLHKALSFSFMSQYYQAVCSIFRYHLELGGEQGISIHLS